MGIEVKGTESPDFWSEDHKYKESWDWLMPVVLKVKETGAGASLLVTDTLCKSDINKTYEAVVEFIKWYNENK